MAASSWIVLAFGSEPVETAVLTRIMFPYLGLVSIAALFQGMLNSYGIFAPSGFAPILFNLCFIAVPMLVSRWTVNPARAMAFGVVAGGFAQAACQLPALLKAGLRFGFISPRRAFANPGMKKVFVLIAPTILGTCQAWCSSRDQASAPSPAESRGAEPSGKTSQTRPLWGKGRCIRKRYSPVPGSYPSFSISTAPIVR